ncbi:hypothetical protein BO71DRAFT_115872 [Aspergillus ellipticus CBS 707.79]|uniref:Uncharacterized protein n=1 Tax=Aspergillus ellipticus CBS 707.79 TaxID=1448320 RepID=A0A319DJI3_9EURO|nr:hypothetical protein BO71DRAFT_115872 [Aspergillus ellipticus CBS 707.79]
MIGPASLWVSPPALHSGIGRGFGLGWISGQPPRQWGAQTMEQASEMSFSRQPDMMWAR